MPRLRFGHFFLAKNYIFAAQSKGEMSDPTDSFGSGQRSTPGPKDSLGESVYTPKGYRGGSMFFSYILKSLKDGKYYYGSTKDLELRLKRHNKEDVKATKSRRPLILHYFEEFETRSEAFRREQFYKSITGYVFLKENSII